MTADDEASSGAPVGTRRLVPPELLPTLDVMQTMDLSPEFIAFLRSGGPGLESFMTLPPLTPEQQSVECREVFAPGLNGAPDVRMLVYTPPGRATRSRPAFLHVHGGGYIIGAPEMADSENRQTAFAHNCIVVSVDYRLAPETRWPGSLEDAYAALLWLHRNATALSVDPARIAVGGESAGGGHAAALAIHARDRGEARICFLFLDSPMLDDRTGSTSDPHPYCGEFVWTPANNRYGWQALLGLEPGGAHVPEYAAPARVRDLSGLPPTFLAVGSLDLFLEENMEFARRLIRAGVLTELYVIPGGFHGYAAAGPNVPQVQTLRALRHAALARAFS